MNHIPKGKGYKPGSVSKPDIFPGFKKYACYTALYTRKEDLECIVE